MGRKTDRTNHGRLTIVLVGLLFLAPMVAARWLHSGGRAARLGAATNHGVLVTPARALDLPGPLVRLDGSPLQMADLRGRWTFVYLGDSTCPVACADSLYKMRQVRLAQGDNMNRVGCLYLLTDTAHLDDLRPILADHPMLDVAVVAADLQEGVLAQFRLEEEAVQQAERVYLLDPLGNLMMAYPKGADPRGMLKDLQRLLKLSRIG
jgi:cytochrome oxidase Cu insertion factor (SCO1/SenC/PrrC family)